MYRGLYSPPLPTCAVLPTCATACRHVECGEGVVFPFSRGCSFYTLNEAGQIATARDLVESAAKPGSASLKASRCRGCGGGGGG